MGNSSAILNLGTRIYKSFLRGRPMRLDGSSIVSNKAMFSLKNPYILEALEPSEIKLLSGLEGKNLRTVCELLDSPAYMQKIQKCNATIPQKGFTADELKLLWKKAFKDKRPWCCNDALQLDLIGLPDSVGLKFDAHGLAKGTISGQLEQLNNLLSNGIDPKRPFFTAPLSIPKADRALCGAGLGTGGGCAYRDGSFIVTSGKGKIIAKDGIENVIVNDAYYGIINDLQKRFPNVKFVKSEDAVGYFSAI